MNLFILELHYLTMNKILLSILGIALFFSCKKEEPEPYTPPPTPSNNYPFQTYIDNSYNQDSIGVGQTIYRKLNLALATSYKITLMHAESYNMNIILASDENLTYQLYNGPIGGAAFEVGFFNNYESIYMAISYPSGTPSTNHFRLVSHQNTLLFPYVNQGSISTPVIKDANLIATGTVDSAGASYYIVENLPVSTNCFMTLYNITSDADLNIYTDASFTTGYAPSLSYVDSIPKPEEYQFSSDASGKAYIKVKCGENNTDGAQFKLYLKQAY